MAAHTDTPLPPLVLDHGDSGGGTGWVELVRASDDIHASLLVGRLEAAGIQTLTIKDRKAPGAWLLAGSNPWAPVTIYVRRLQVEDARIVFAEIALEAPDSEASPRAVEEVPLRWWIAAVGLGIVLTVLSLAQYR